MRGAWLVAWALAVTTSSAAAAPAADAVIAWGARPLGATGDAIADAARRGGAAYVDVTPAAAARPPDARAQVLRGIDAYGALDFDAALAALDAAVATIDLTGAAGVDTATLSDLFIYRAQTRAQRGDAAGWDDVIVAATIAPARVLDSARFSPRAIEQFARARAAVTAQPRATLRLAGAAGCRVTVDGAPVTGDTVDVPFGRHWVRGECEGREAVGRALAVERERIDVIVAGDVIAPPTDDELLIQGTALGARAIVVVIVRGPTLVARRLGRDGREQDRASAAVADPRAVGDAVLRVVKPQTAPAPRPWYRSGWVWAAAGAAVASAILIPIAASGGDRPADIRPTGALPW